jgi:hypothetical protein
MRRLRPILLAVPLLLPAISLAAEMCPWLNAATAGGVLGGAVSMTVSRRDSNKDDANCDFVRKQGAAMYELRIKVQTMGEAVKEFASYKAQCGSAATPLKAIGNEAVACSLDDKNGHRTAQVVSRVRDRAFLVSVSTTDSSITLASLSQKARNVAEQVAGNLF